MCPHFVGCTVKQAMVKLGKDMSRSILSPISPLDINFQSTYFNILQCVPTMETEAGEV